MCTAPASLRAQVVDPTTAEFDPSSDHNAVLSSGSPAVSRYDLEFYLPGAGSPFQVASMGKPSPGGDGKIRVALASVVSAFPSPGIVYVAKAAAVGPNGVGRGDPSNTFMFSVPCTFSASPLTQTISGAGGTATASVTAAAGCAWTAASNASWLTITGGALGTGSGTVSYAATANTLSTTRIGTLTVAGQTVQVTQGAACGFTVSPTTASVGAGGGSGSVSVTTASGCGWTATSSAGWLTITNGASGSGNGTVTYAASANAAFGTRSAVLSVGGQTVSLTQQAPKPTAPGNLRIVTP